MITRRISVVLSSLLLCLFVCSAAGAVVVNANTNPNDLGRALLGSNSGIVITSTALEYCYRDAAVSTGTYTNDSGAYGIGPGIVLSTGSVEQCGDSTGMDLSFVYGIPASSTATELLTPVSDAGSYYDATRFDIVFNLMPGYDGISLDAVFGSEEYPRWLHTVYNDGLGIYINGENIASVDGLPVNINNRHVIDPKLVPEIGNTSLDGVLAPGNVPLLSFHKTLFSGAQSNHLTFVIGDASDASFDSVAFIGNLRANRVVPEPSSMLTLSLMSAGALIAALRRRVR